MSNGKYTIIHLVPVLTKKRRNWLKFYCIKMSQYFRKPYESFGWDINVKVDLFNYPTKTDIENDTWSFALKSNFASLKTETDKLDIEKLVPVSVDLNKLSDLVKMMLLW